MTPASTATPDQLLLLRAALGRGEDARRAWDTWRTRAPLDRLDAESQRLLPLLYRNLRRQGVTDLPARLAGAYKQTWARNTYAFRAAAEAVKILDGAGIATVVLKGAALALLHYEDRGVRAMNDVDVLVPRARLREAFEVLAASGWTCRHAFSEDLASTHHSIGVRDGKGGVIDLHWHAAQDAKRPGADDELWRTSVPLRLGDVDTRALGPTAIFFHVCAHAYHTGHRHVRWMADATTILRSAPLDGALLLALCRDRAFVLPMRVALTRLRDDLDAPIPPDLVAAFAAEPVPLLDRVEHELAVSSRPYTLAGVGLRLWCWHRRATTDRGLTLVTSFPDYLRRYYRLPSTWSLARVGLERVKQRARTFGVF